MEKNLGNNKHKALVTKQITCFVLKVTMYNSNAQFSIFIEAFTNSKNFVLTKSMRQLGTDDLTNFSYFSYFVSNLIPMFRLLEKLQTSDI